MFPIISDTHLQTHIVNKVILLDWLNIHIFFRLACMYNSLFEFQMTQRFKCIDQPKKSNDILWKKLFLYNIPNDLSSVNQWLLPHTQKRKEVAKWTRLDVRWGAVYQWFSIPVLETPCSSAYLPYLTHLIEIISLVGERAMNWTNELMISIRCVK